MRIGYLVNQYPAVSHSFIRREIEALERQGFEVVRISLRGWDRDLVDPADLRERERTRFVLRAGAARLLAAALRALVFRPVHFVRALALARRMARRHERPLPVHLAYLLEACLIERWLREAGARHLHAHFGSNPAEVAMLVNALGGPSWSFTAHGGAVLENPGFLGLPEKIRRAAFAVGASSFTRAQLMLFSDPADWPRLEVVHCGLEPAFHAGAEAAPPAARRLVCIGRLCPEKAQLLLVEAARRLAEAGVAFELVLGGDGELRPQVEALIARHRLGRLVRVTGWLTAAQVRGEVLAARALVLPSFAEGLPVVIMEAMALRRPVIATHIAGIPELVVPGEHGWLVPAGDVEVLVRAMRECLHAEPDTLARMGAAARARVLARHDVDVGAGKLAALMRRTVEAQKQRGSGLPEKRADVRSLQSYPD